MLYKMIPRTLYEYHVTLHGERGQAKPVERVLVPIDGMDYDVSAIRAHLERTYAEEAPKIYPEIGPISAITVTVTQFPYPIWDLVVDADTRTVGGTYVHG